MGQSQSQCEHFLYGNKYPSFLGHIQCFISLLLSRVFCQQEINKYIVVKKS